MEVQVLFVIIVVLGLFCLPAVAIRMVTKRQASMALALGVSFGVALVFSIMASYGKGAPSGGVAASIPALVSFFVLRAKPKQIPSE